MKVRKDIVQHLMCSYKPNLMQASYVVYILATLYTQMVLFAHIVF